MESWMRIGCVLGSSSSFALPIRSTVSVLNLTRRSSISGDGWSLRARLLFFDPAEIEKIVCEKP